MGEEMYVPHVVQAPHWDEDEVGDVCTAYGKCTTQPVCHRDEDEVGDVFTTCGIITHKDEDE